jgi:cobalt/nickel transport system permease protein
VSDIALCTAGADERPRLDRLDTRVRLVAALATVIAVLVVRSPMVLLGLCPVALAAAGLAGLEARTLVHRLLRIEGFLLVLAVLLPLTVPGETWATIGPLTLSKPGVERAALVLLRVNLSALAIVTLVGGLEPVRLGHALARLGVPLKLVHVLLFSARWVALIGEEAERLHDALRARAFRARTSLHTLRTLGHFLGQLLVRAFERAERVDEAMRCRAFAGRFAMVAEERPSRYDAAFAAGLAFGLVLPILVDRLI